MVDSRSSAVQLVDLWGSQPRVLFSVSGPTLLAGFQRAGDWLLPGDFLGRGRAQLLGVSRQPGAGDRLAFVEFAGNGAMAVVYNQPFSKRGCLDGLLESGDSLYAADFQGTGGKRVQLLVTNPNTQSESAAAPSFGLGNRPASIPVPSYFGNRFISVGDAYGVVAMAWHQGALYIVSNNHLYKRLSFAEGSGNAWGEAGEAYGVVAMASHQGSLYIVSNNHLYKRGALGPGTGNDWGEAGEAYGVTAMASHQGSLYIVSNNHLYKRGALGPGTGNDWSGEVGEAWNVPTMTSHQGELYILSVQNRCLYRRGAIGPSTGNDWFSAGNAAGVIQLACSEATVFSVCDNGLYILN
jgi:hypothetical protein